MEVWLSIDLIYHVIYPSSPPARPPLPPPPPPPHPPFPLSPPRAAVRSCEAVFVFPDLSSFHPESEDSMVIIRATTVKRYDPRSRVLAVLLKLASKSLMEGDLGVETLCVEEVKYNLLAQVGG